jgi:2-keto-3-deoxy-L-rhamnonate aldolase RhmA
MAHRVGLGDRLASGEPLYGTFLGLGAALAAEACAVAGFDWLLVDLEHGGGGEASLLSQLSVAEAHDVPVLVRVESTERIRESAAQAEAAMRHLRYPPAGDRGVATYNRAYGFGLYPEGLETANDRIVGLVQIESRGALDVVHEIAAVPGVDVLFVGPRDLSHDLGVPGRIDSPEFQQALERILKAADAAGVTTGILAPHAEQGRRYAAMGFRFVGVSSDATLLVNAARQAVTQLRTPVQ